ncbi:Class E vacuolar protein-sorting machinery protein hse1 [Ceratocystis fimbriata CBS 114723]|uniref:Class E vacuolar protein-sorting machinery protein HSE1 n=1 Tax=Ceratocystis fimbriata CBS 114723 TaxID=1035309 RepID=A0A2C5WZ82_9PEZI|nr:Class E vacuolar protein-sorting machinery protein hse1 [Ceratocystis fimbriata CBS 114723]
MFRTAATNPYDESVAKATDENLTSEDWGAIIDLCDRVTNDEKGPKDVIQSVIKRLTHRNANVQLYTLEIANALSLNCGEPMHREMASRAFTDALLKLANDRNTHSQVKPKIMERMKGWTEMFQNDPDLGIMKTAFYQLKQTNPTLEPPSAPQKNRLTDVDRQREEEELQKALELSLQDEVQRKTPRPASGSAGPSNSGPGLGSGTDGAAPSSTPANNKAPETHVPVSSQRATAATVSRVRALYDFIPSEDGELEFKKGDIIAVLESVFKDWWRGSLRGHIGIFPLNYVEKLTDPTPEELQREAMMEAEVFSEIRNVEKLLTLLSTSSSTPGMDDNEEISKLYQRTTAIRPKLIKLIEKYSQKKDDFTQLNEKFIKARRDYETLLEASMTHPPPHQYHQYNMGQQQPGYGGPAGGRPGAGYTPSPAPAGTAPPGDQRFYNVPDQQHSSQQYPPVSTSPSNQYRRYSNSTPAPFYVSGTEVSAAPSQPPPTQQSYPIRPAGSNPPAGANIGSQPAPISTSANPQSQQYQPYSQPTNNTRPQSTYGAQELATSVYDSPINTAPPGNPYGTELTTEQAATTTSPPPSAPPASAAQPAAPVPFAQPQPPTAQFKSYQHANHSSISVPPVPTGSAPPIPTSAAPSAPSSAPPPPPAGSTATAPGSGPQQFRPYVPTAATAGGDDATDYYRTGY